MEIEHCAYTAACELWDSVVTQDIKSWIALSKGNVQQVELLLDSIGWLVVDNML